MNWVIEPWSSVQLKKIKCNFDGRGFVSLSVPVYPSGEIIWEMQRYQVLSRLPEKPCETLWRYETLISRPIMCYGSTHMHIHKRAQRLPQWPWRAAERIRQRENVMRKRWPGETCSDFISLWSRTWKPEETQAQTERQIGNRTCWNRLSRGASEQQEENTRRNQLQGLEKICHPCRHLRIHSRVPLCANSPLLARKVAHARAAERKKKKNRKKKKEKEMW